MPDEYLTVVAEGEYETEVNRSRFLCALAPAATEEAALAFVARVRERHPTASHHCYAYVIGADGAVRRASDDGEPSGTAGQPMLNMLLRREVRFVVAVVTRYFGGTKLGAGGLIRAYGGAVGTALDAHPLATRRRLRLATVTVDHARAGRLENDLRALGHPVREVGYGAEVAITVALPAAELDAFAVWLAGATAGAARLDLGGETHGAG
ncbi:YigZ family protein [Streptomyces sp. DSM 44915]|uniref:YigZ family protein n=1 Tax=Streptomyces chisholmiae TaxID=3075540 RepID=A0ABU2JLP7_9ACTN|nr:YigZ family protein [Streptomyces sp. DSM 44915]MDT0265901.1 YigZ family protein [Streptomyces sp. DSM 44915]